MLASVTHLPCIVTSWCALSISLATFEMPLLQYRRRLRFIYEDKFAILARLPYLRHLISVLLFA
jgi:hypothetical protein